MRLIEIQNVFNVINMLGLTNQLNLIHIQLPKFDQSMLIHVHRIKRELPCKFQLNLTKECQLALDEGIERQDTSFYCCSAV